MAIGDDIKTYIGWDIGGAHLKYARLLSTGKIESLQQIACPLWQGIAELERAYRLVANDNTATQQIHVLTMTGELVDGFDDRKQGVHSILNAMHSLLKQSFWVYTNDSGIIDYQAINDTASVASMNWRATAEWLVCHHKEGILVDMGSTTTDIVPFKSHRIAVQGYDDATRLKHGELIYSGMTRTPVMAIADHFIIDGVCYPIMAESFATMADVYRILGNLDEDSDLYPSSDNADKTIASSARRLERMFGVDWNGDIARTRIKAQAIALRQQQKIGNALLALLKREQLTDNACIIGAGAGYKIVQCIAERLGLQFIPYHQLWDNLANDLVDSVCCCATALSIAMLAQQKHL